MDEHALAQWIRLFDAARQIDVSVLVGVKKLARKTLGKVEYDAVLARWDSHPYA